MAKQVQNKKVKKAKEEYITEEVLQSADTFALKTEKFLERNAKIISIVFGGILVAAIGYFAYLNFYADPNNAEAQTKLIKAQDLFQKDSLDAALGGSANLGSDGFADIYENYASTSAGKVSAFYAGIIEYKKGNYQKAIDYLNDFSSSDDIANALKYGAIGDCNVQLKKNEEALQNFDKAIDKATNSGTKVFFLKKAGILASEMKKYKESLDYFQTIADKYPDVDTSGEVDAYVEKLTYLHGNG